MSTPIAQRLEWLYSRMSQREISRQTGIPRPTLYSWKKSGRDPTTRWAENVKTVFHRESYKALREGGYTTRMAANFYKSSPENIEKKVRQVNKFADVLTARLIRKWSIRAMERGEDFNEAEEFTKLRAKIVAGLRASRKGLSDWMQYISEAKKIFAG